MLLLWEVYSLSKLKTDEKWEKTIKANQQGFRGFCFVFNYFSIAKVVFPITVHPARSKAWNGCVFQKSWYHGGWRLFRSSLYKYHNSICLKACLRSIFNFQRLKHDKRLWILLLSSWKILYDYYHWNYYKSTLSIFKLFFFSLNLKLKIYLTR